MQNNLHIILTKFEVSTATTTSRLLRYCGFFFPLHVMQYCLLKTSYQKIKHFHHFQKRFYDLIDSRIK